MDNPGNTGDLDPHAANLVSSFESMMERIGKSLRRQDQKPEKFKQPSIGSSTHRAYPRFTLFEDKAASNNNEKINKVWESGWCSTKGNGYKVKAVVGRSQSGYHPGLFGQAPKQELKVDWGQPVEREADAKGIAQEAASEWLGRYEHVALGRGDQGRQR